MKTCSTCKHMHPVGDKNREGFCRINPPSIAGFPRVMIHNDCCSQHALAPVTSDDRQEIINLLNSLRMTQGDKKLLLLRKWAERGVFAS